MSDVIVIPQDPIKKLPGWSTISGTVTDDNSQPVSGVNVNVTGTTHDGETATGTAKTAQGGQFSFYAPPGNYTISPTGPSGDRIVGAGSCNVTVSGGQPTTVSCTVRGGIPPK